MIHNNINQVDNPCIETEPITPRILASIRSQKEAAKQEHISHISKNCFQRLWEFFFQGKTSKKRSIQKRPELSQALKFLNVSSNTFTKKQKAYLEQLEHCHFPQMAKTKIGYELIEHLSKKPTSTLPKTDILIGNETFEVIDGKGLSHPIFVHATEMKTAPLILNDLSKFFSDNVKLSTSLFDTGKEFFHSNDPDDYYVALGLTVDPRNFYRNYPEDIDSPTYNKDPTIATHGYNDLVHVETHIKMNKVLGLIGAYVQDLQQRVYQTHDERSPYSDTDRIYRLERELEWNPSKSTKEKIRNELRKLRKQTGHKLKLKIYWNGMINGTTIYNFTKQTDELVHLADTGKVQDKILEKEIHELDKVLKGFAKKHDRLAKFFSYLLHYPIGERIKDVVSSFFHCCMGPLYNRSLSLRRIFIPYHLSNYNFLRLIRFLGPTETLAMTDSYNEYEALSHEWGKEAGARPIGISSILMSRNALTKLQESKDMKEIESFKTLYECAKKHNLPILIVDT